MEDQDIRWKQRFEHFDRAFLRLHEALQLPELNELERNGLMQRFEFTLELAWKTLKDYLEYQGFAFRPSPKETLRQAYEAGYLENVQALIDGYDMRNQLSHDYSDEKFRHAEKLFREETNAALVALHRFLKDNLDT